MFFKQTIDYYRQNIPRATPRRKLNKKISGTQAPTRVAAAVLRCRVARPAHVQLGAAPDGHRAAPGPRALAAGPALGQRPAELAYYACYGPRRASLVDLAWIAGSRWHTEECFQQARNEAGLDHYQVRSWRAWYAHITLSMLALAWLAASRARAQKGNRPPAS